MYYKKKENSHKSRRGGIIYSYQRVSLSHTYYQKYKRHANAFSQVDDSKLQLPPYFLYLGSRSTHSSFFSLSLSLFALTYSYQRRHHAVTSITSSYILFGASTSRLQVHTRRRTGPEASAPIIFIVCSVAKYLSTAGVSYKLKLRFSFIIIYLIIFNYFLL